jgi:DNA-binding MarR family transcriptional regulator
VLCPRRGVVVELTAAGHERIERTLDELLRHEQRLLAGLADDQRDRLEEALRALLATLEDHLER